MENKISESSQQIKLGAVISYLNIVVNSIAGLIYTPWMVNQIGADDYGIYTLAMSLINIFLIDFGLSAAVSRFISKYNAEGNQEGVNKLLGVTYKLYLLIDLIILIALIIVYFNTHNIYQGLTPDELGKFEVVYVIAAIFSLISFPFMPLNGILTAYEKFIELKICDLFQRVFSIIFIVFALLNGYGLYALVASNAVSGILTIIIKYSIIKIKTNTKVNFKYKNRALVKEISSFSVWTAIIGIAQRFIFNITPTILGIFSKTVNIAIFGIASSLEGYVFTLANALNGLFLPRVTRITTKKGWENELLFLMIKIGRIQLFIISLIIIGFISIGKDFVLLWMGENYINSFYSAVLLILPSLIYLPQQIGNTAVIALNKVKYQALIFVIMAFINVILSTVFSYFWGAIGASLAISLAYIFRSVGMNIIYYKIIQIDIIIFFKECYGKLFIPLSLTLFISLFINLFFHSLSWKILIIKGILIVLVFFSIMWVFAFNDYEKKLITSIFKKLK